MQAAGITLSTIGTGGGSAQILRRLAEESGGRYYDAADATTIPDIFLRETIRTAGEQIVEEPFQPIPSAPSEILDGLDAGRLPQLLGYNATTAKGSATVSLLTAREDPLLAQWQYGLGRAVAWTSDARQQWATPWIGTPEFGTLTAQLVAWTLPPQDAEGIDVRFTPGEDGELNVEVTSFDDEAGPRNFYRTVLRLVSPDLEPTQTLLEQVGPGRYAGTVRADQQGAYLVRVAQTFEDESGTDAASRTLGIVSPAAEEFRRLGIDADALATYAARRRRAASSRSPTRRPRRRSGRTTSRPAPSRPRSGRGCSCWRSCWSPSTSACAAWRSAAPTCGEPARGPARRVGMGRAEPEAVPGLAELRAAKERSARRAERVVSPAAGGAGPSSATASPAPAAAARRAARVARAAPTPAAAAPPPAVAARASAARRWPSGSRDAGGRADQSGSSSSRAASSSAGRGSGLERGTRRRRATPATATRATVITAHGRAR